MISAESWFLTHSGLCLLLFHQVKDLTEAFSVARLFIVSLIPLSFLSCGVWFLSSTQCLFPWNLEECSTAPLGQKSPVLSPAHRLSWLCRGMPVQLPEGAGLVGPVTWRQNLSFRIVSKVTQHRCCHLVFCTPCRKSRAVLLYTLAVTGMRLPNHFTGHTYLCVEH